MRLAPALLIFVGRYNDVEDLPEELQEAHEAVAVTLGGAAGEIWVSTSIHG